MIPPIINNDNILIKDDDKTEAINEYFTSTSDIDNPFSDLLLARS